MSLQAVWAFGRAPSFSNETVYIGSKHCAGMIQVRAMVTKTDRSCCSRESAPASLAMIAANKSPVDATIEDSFSDYG